MEIGTWGEWAGAIGTTFAAVVALHLGLRDATIAQARSEARARIRGIAAPRYRDLVRHARGLDDSLLRDDVANYRDGDEAVELTEAAAQLGMIRRRFALAMTRSIYGRYYVQVALVAPRGDVTPLGSDLHTDLRTRLGVQAITEGKSHPVTGTPYHRALQRPMNKRMIARLRRRFWLLAHV